MDDATIRRLNEINREFYRLNADDFDQTRGQPWPGWEALLPYLPLNPTPCPPPHCDGEGEKANAQHLSVLDVGCGNGRFGVFLAHTLKVESLQYHGVDNNPALLEHARLAITELSQVSVVLEERDIVEKPPTTDEYDLVALFGILHHVPGYERRLSLIRSLAERVAPGGMLAFACWRFYEYERFRERIVPWPEDIEVEPNDYLLDWRRGHVTLRYCHYVDDTEHAALVVATGMREVVTYRADGQTGDANRYSLLRH